MGIQYKSNGTWKNISSSSNNAVDTVENGNMNPVTSNAVYDMIAALSPFNKTPTLVATTGGPGTTQNALWTATKDCWVTAAVLTCDSNGAAAILLSIDGGTSYKQLYIVSGQAAASEWAISLGFPVKKDWIVQIVGGYGIVYAWI